MTHTQRNIMSEILTPAFYIKILSGMHCNAIWVAYLFQLVYFCTVSTEGLAWRRAETTTVECSL